jgi:hypothetical protein
MASKKVDLHPAIKGLNASNNHENLKEDPDMQNGQHSGDSFSAS